MFVLKVTILILLDVVRKRVVGNLSQVSIGIQSRRDWLREIGA